MEVTLTLPLGLWLLVAFRSQPANWSFGRSVAIGLLAALTMLSRLDAVFLILALLTFTLLEREQRWGLGMRQIGGFALGGSPLLAAYFLFNHFYFHTWMPISGSAKQLKSSPWPTTTALDSAGLNTVVLGVFLVYAAVALWLVRNRLEPGERPVLAAASVFPFLQLGVLSFVSDWPLWGWYFYTVRFAMLAGLVLLLALVGAARIARVPDYFKAAAFALAIVLLLRTHYKVEPQMVMIYDAAVRIQAFEQTHPGIYAMGGGAGMPGYLLRSPIIQTEGLMMDPGYLQHIRHHDDLLPMLHSYGVRYYIVWEVDERYGFRRFRDADHCFLAEEPDDPTGPLALHIYGRVCQAPVADIVSQFSTEHIYDLSQNPRKP